MRCIYGPNNSVSWFDPFFDFMMMHYILLTMLMVIINGDYLWLILQHVYLIDANSELKHKQMMQIHLVGYIRAWDNKVMSMMPF